MRRRIHICLECNYALWDPTAACNRLYLELWNKVYRPFHSNRTLINSINWYTLYQIIVLYFFKVTKSAKTGIGYVPRKNVQKSNNYLWNWIRFMILIKLKKYIFWGSASISLHFLSNPKKKPNFFWIVW